MIFQKFSENFRQVHGGHTIKLLSTNCLPDSIQKIFGHFRKSLISFGPNIWHCGLHNWFITAFREMAVNDLQNHLLNKNGCFLLKNSVFIYSVLDTFRFHKNPRSSTFFLHLYSEGCNQLTS